jgi:DNA-binding response OmpR family regulator
MTTHSLSLRLMTGDPHLRARWNRWLTAQGWSVVDVPASGVLASLPRTRAGPVLLDASLLKAADMTVVRELSASKVPVIIFGDGTHATNESVVRWLHEGADDFIPAAIQEKLLVAKLEAYARRILPELDRTVLFSRRREVKADSKRGLAWTKKRGHWQLTEPLTDTEHRILCLFLSLPETLLEREYILQRIWAEKSAEVFEATLTQHVMSLRKKLETHGEAIRTVYGRGYIFSEES